MARKTGVSGIFSMSGFEKPVVQPKKPINPHTEQYNDDGKVITMSLEKFFSGFAEYSKFLNDGSRSYMSLTDAIGDEIFQFSMVDAFHESSLDKIDHAVSVNGKLGQKNIRRLLETISEQSDAPMIMQTDKGHVYGVLYPMVRLVKE